MSDPLNPVVARSNSGAREMQIRFDGKTVVVSGAGHGFGRCIAETFAGLGARVFGCDLVAAELAETAKAGVSTELVDLTDRAGAGFRLGPDLRRQYRCGVYIEPGCGSRHEARPRRPHR